MASIFLNRINRPVQLSMLFFEVFGELLEAACDERPDVEIGVLLAEAYRTTTGDTLTEDQLTYAATRAVKLNEGGEGASDEAEKANAGKSFATGYLKWLADMKPDACCLFAANYDFEVAETLYCHVDRDDVLDMLKAKSEAEWQRHVVAFEACLFGFGGGYGKNTGGNEIDMNKDRGAAIDQLKSLGF